MDARVFWGVMAGVFDWGLQLVLNGMVSSHGKIHLKISCFLLHQEYDCIRRHGPFRGSTACPSCFQLTSEAGAGALCRLFKLVASKYPSSECFSHFFGDFWEASRSGRP